MPALDSYRLNHQVSSLTSLLERSHGESLSLRGEGKAPLSSASKPSMLRCQACEGSHLGPSRPSNLSTGLVPGGVAAEPAQISDPQN